MTYDAALYLGLHFLPKYTFRSKWYTQGEINSLLSALNSKIYDQHLLSLRAVGSNALIFPILRIVCTISFHYSCPNIYVSWSTSELRVRLAPLNRFKPSSKIFYWPFQGGTSFVDLLCFCSVLCLLCFVRVCLYVLRGHLLGKGWPLGSRLWCLLWVCHFPIGILGQVWYLIVSIPDLCNLTYFTSYIK